MNAYAASFVIEKNIPLPKGTPNKGYSKYPFAEMQVGDSFLFSGPAGRIRSAVSQHSRRHGGKFSVRIEGRGFRVWRVE